MGSIPASPGDGKAGTAGCGQAIAPSPLRVLILQILAGNIFPHRDLCFSILLRQQRKQTAGVWHCLSKAKAQQQLRGSKHYAPSCSIKKQEGKDLSPPIRAWAALVCCSLVLESWEEHSVKESFSGVCLERGAGRSRRVRDEHSLHFRSSIPTISALCPSADAELNENFLQMSHQARKVIWGIMKL